MSVISSGNYSSFLLPLATKAFGDAMKEQALTYNRIFEVRKSDRQFEELTLLSGLGMARAKTEGAAIEYDSMKQAFTQRATHVTYALGFVVTQEAIDDVKGEEVAMHRARQLKRAHMRKIETVANNVLNNSVTAGFTFADGKVLLATDHPSLIGSQSNKLAVAADLTDASLEQILIQIMSAKDYDGAPCNLAPTKLIIPPALSATAFRILESQLRSSTADNDANFNRGKIPEVVVSNYLDDADAWYVKTDADDGLIMFERKPLMLEQDKDFDTSNVRFKASTRYSVTVGDWRTVYGSEGAG